MALKLTDLVIDPKCLGNRFLLVGIEATYLYKNGEKTEIQNGYKYTVMLPEKKCEKLSVKIEGKQQIPDEYCEVEFEGLQIYIYWLSGRYRVAACATRIRKKE